MKEQEAVGVFLLIIACPFCTSVFLRLFAHRFLPFVSDLCADRDLPWWRTVV